MEVQKKVESSKAVTLRHWKRLLKGRKITSGGFLFPRPGVDDPSLNVQRRMIRRMQHGH